jgi:hypothetical protein
MSASRQKRSYDSRCGCGLIGPLSRIEIGNSPPSHSQTNARCVGERSGSEMNPIPAKRSTDLRRAPRVFRTRVSQATFLDEARLDRLDVSFAIAQSVGRRVDRVIAKDEIMLVRHGRTENEFGIAQRFELDGTV